MLALSLQPGGHDPGRGAPSPSRSPCSLGEGGDSGPGLASFAGPCRSDRGSSGPGFAPPRSGPTCIGAAAPQPPLRAPAPRHRHLQQSTRHPCSRRGGRAGGTLHSSVALRTHTTAPRPPGQPPPRGHTCRGNPPGQPSGAHPLGQPSGADNTNCTAAR